MSKRTFTFWATSMVGAVLLVCSIAFADDLKDDAREKASAIGKRLADLTKDLASLQKSINTKNTQYFQYQRKLEYKKGPVSKIYHEVKQLEKQLLERRQDLNAELLKDEGAKQLIAERNALYQKQLVLRERRQLLENEMKAARLRVGAIAQKDTE